jgi:DNA primase
MPVSKRKGTTASKRKETAASKRKEADDQAEATTTKYEIHAQIETDGVVEKPDVIGAIFGQTEGLLGDDLDLRELLKTGRIGRIDAGITSRGGRSTGTIRLPSSLDKIDTAILAASLETVDRVGPCEARINVLRIEDVRAAKRRVLVERAKQILNNLFEDVTIDTTEISSEIKQSFKVGEISKYGSENLPAGPSVDESDSLIVVEGRADVLNLLKAGVKNCIAVEGTNVPKTIAELTKNKTTIAFVDGDRGGELILRELFQVADVSYVAQGPPGKSVEDMNRKEIITALKDRVPVDHYFSQREKNRVDQSPEMQRFRDILREIQGTRKSRLLGKELDAIGEVDVSKLIASFKGAEGVMAVVLDGIITQRLIDVAADADVRYLVGAKIGNVTKKPPNLHVLSQRDLPK